MGSCKSKHPVLVVEEVAKRRNGEIEKNIEEEKKHTQMKLLLLGTAESGKSTLLKQMRILHEQGFSEQELSTQKAIVYATIIDSMATLIRAMDTLGIIPTKKSTHDHVELILEVVQSQKESVCFTPEVAAALSHLWNEEQGIKECYQRRAELQISDSIKYFFENLLRISEENYEPNSVDMLYIRVPTNGVVEVKFVIKNVIFRVFDVGGQRSERRKWIHIFDDVNAIIFVCALSEYDQMLMEDDKTNRMHESLTLFTQVSNSELFGAKTAVMLFLNKKDLFAEKIKITPLTKTFPEYTGLSMYAPAADFIQARFESVCQRRDRTLYVHRTCATDTNQVQLVLDGVMDMILSDIVEKLGVS